VPRKETYPGAGPPLSDCIADLWESDTHSCLETNLENNPYYPFVTREQYKYIQCGIKKKGMKTYYDNVVRARTPAFGLVGIRMVIMVYGCKRGLE